MPRVSDKPKLPAIAVEDETIKKTFALSKELDAEIGHYAEYFQASSGKKPRSLDDVMTGIMSAFLKDDSGFQKWKKEAKSKPAASASFAAKDARPAPSTDCSTPSNAVSP